MDRPNFKRSSEQDSYQSKKHCQLPDSSYGAKNQFQNDGSFIKQFQSSSGSGQPSKVAASKSLYSAFTSGGYEYSKSQGSANSDSGNLSLNEAKVQQELEEKQTNPSEQAQIFQNALKLAKQKAQELAKVSHPANPNTPTQPAVRTGTACGGVTGVASSSSMPGVQQYLPGSFSMPPAVMSMMNKGQHMEAIQGIMLTSLTRDNPAIVAYARSVFGTLDLSEAQWKQCEEQMKMNIVFQILQSKKREAEVLAQAGKTKYEYDSDEEIDEHGTWEHKRRKAEMMKTYQKAEELTKTSEGKHHIGDFLPPEELATFMEKYHSMKDGKDPDMSDYKENKLTEDNIGYKMLKSMGWTEGTGLGSEGTGITAPINQKTSSDKTGLGTTVPHDLSANDDEFDAYRKRMMLAYRFRPNPLNNPRRSYY